ncbi:hypothetical protein [Actinomadura rudentiformis]|uniref:Uncharacterized protein n=1 Tax=Actinomadura rudentiformis TaxID=359158 RepID=A0A6H9YL76_9ACTN|nr:hypothetical protein [Actinomadura rudentiformis]KAB2337995.1 hypothetical protein F8566_49155 [Actinomadura rudentiformis]
MRKSDRWSFIALAIGVVVILGGVQVFAMLDDPPEPSPAPKLGFCPDGPAGGARSGTGYEEVAAPYQGKGPHPVELVLMQDDVERIELPLDWKPGPGDGPPKVQIVACVYQDVIRSSGKRRTCLYSRVPGHLRYPTQTDPSNAIKVSLLEVRYVFQVYEAKTAKPLGRFEVAGAKSCPFQYRLNSGGVIAQEPDEDGVRKALRPYVERTLSPQRSPTGS